MAASIRVEHLTPHQWKAGFLPVTGTVGRVINVRLRCLCLSRLGDDWLTDGAERNVPRAFSAWRSQQLPSQRPGRTSRWMAGGSLLCQRRRARARKRLP